jgi:hypothetical protein
VRWSRQVELATGAKKDVQLLFQANASGPSRNLIFTTPSGRRAMGNIQLQRVPATTIAVAIIGMDPLGLPAALRTATVENLPRSSAHDTRILDDEATRAVRGAVIPPQDMPTQSMALSALDWIVWSDPDPRALSDAQAIALTSWVADGGHLLLAVTETARQLHNSPMDRLLPGRIGQPTLQDVLPFVVRVDPKATEPGRIPVASLTAGPRTTLLATTTEGAPLWVANPFGLGTVHVLLADLRLSPIADLEREALWRTLLWTPASGAVTPPADAPFAATFVAHTTSEDYEEYESSVRKELSDVPGLSPLPISWLVLASALYLFVIGPLDYTMLRVFKRQPYTWITFPVAIVVFTLASAFGLRSTKGSQAMLTRLEIIQVLPDAQRWRGDDFFGVFSTRKTDLTITSGFADAVIQPLHEPGFMPSPVLTAGFGPGLVRYRAETWTMAYARSSWTQTQTGKLEYSHTAAGMTVTNLLGVDLDDVGLYDGERKVAAFGPLADGATVTLPAGGSGTASDALRRFESLQPPYLPTRGHIDDESFQLVGVAHQGVEPLMLDGLSPVAKSFVIFRQTIPRASLHTPASTDTP